MWRVWGNWLRGTGLFVTGIAMVVFCFVAICRSLLKYTVLIALAVLLLLHSLRLSCL